MASQPIAPIEIGSFTASSPHKTEFIGSASGVFFVKTVFRAFTQSAASSSNGVSGHRASGPQSPAAADHGSVNSRLIDPEMPEQAADESHLMKIELDLSEPHHAQSSARSYFIRGHGLGIAPDQDIAQELLKTYLRNWHPLFPFLHGPTLLDSILGIYINEPPEPGCPSPSMRTRLCQAIICQCVFNIAALDWKGGRLSPESCIESPTKLLAVLGYLASSHDTQSIQALVAAQLFLLCTMSLRAASTVGGTLARVIYHAGLHRCPFRYPQVAPDECDIRKRIFWTAYILDRYVSQSLGHPLSYQDAEVDVCIPGLGEFHKRVSAHTSNTATASAPESDVLDHLPQSRPDNEGAGHVHPARQSTTAGRRNNDLDHGQHDQSPQPPQLVEQPGQAAEILGHYVLYCRLTGQALQIFHKSLQNRTINREIIMELQSSVHAWWNELPRKLQEEYSGGPLESTSTFTFFFITIYNQLLLLINRPFLSLAPDSLEFRTSLQSCISAARQIITTSRHQSNWQLGVSWPGMLPMKWMAGLVLSFACTLNLYPFNKARQEIEDCIQELSAIDQKWNNARHCAAALRSLLDHLSNQHSSSARRSLPESGLPDLTQSSKKSRGADGEQVGGRDAHASEARPTKRIRQDPAVRQPGTVASNPPESPELLQNDAQNLGGRIEAGSQNQTMVVDDFNPDVTQLPDFRALDFGHGGEQGSHTDGGDLFSLPIGSDLYAGFSGGFPGGFGNIEWESMANTWGSMQDWSNWDMPNS